MIFIKTMDPRPCVGNRRFDECSKLGLYVSHQGVQGASHHVPVEIRDCQEPEDRLCVVKRGRLVVLDQNDSAPTRHPLQESIDRY